MTEIMEPEEGARYESRRQSHEIPPGIRICAQNILFTWYCLPVDPTTSERWTLAVNSVSEFLLVDPTFSQRQERSEMSHGLEHQKVPGTRTSSSWWGMLWHMTHISQFQKITKIWCSPHGTVHRVSHEELSMRKVCAKWEPHLLTEAVS